MFLFISSYSCYFISSYSMSVRFLYFTHGAVLIVHIVSVRRFNACLYCFPHNISKIFRDVIWIVLTVFMKYFMLYFGLFPVGLIRCSVV